MKYLPFGKYDIFADANIKDQIAPRFERIRAPSDEGAGLTARSDGKTEGEKNIILNVNAA